MLMMWSVSSCNDGMVRSVQLPARARTGACIRHSTQPPYSDGGPAHVPSLCGFKAAAASSPCLQSCAPQRSEAARTLAQTRCAGLSCLVRILRLQGAQDGRGSRSHRRWRQQRPESHSSFLTLIAVPPELKVNAFVLRTLMDPRRPTPVQMARAARATPTNARGAIRVRK